MSNNCDESEMRGETTRRLDWVSFLLCGYGLEGWRVVKFNPKHPFQPSAIPERCQFPLTLPCCPSCSAAGRAACCHLLKNEELVSTRERLMQMKLCLARSFPPTCTPDVVVMKRVSLAAATSPWTTYVQSRAMIRWTPTSKLDTDTGSCGNDNGAKVVHGSTPTVQMRQFKRHCQKYMFRQGNGRNDAEKR